MTSELIRNASPETTAPEVTAPVRTATTRAPQLEPAFGEPAPRCQRVTTRRPSPHDGRSGQAVRPTAPSAGVPPRGQAEAAIRAIVEVIDKRRTFNQVRQLLDPAIRDAAASLIAARTRANTSRTGQTAILTTAHVQLVHADAAEVFGTYSRGDRVHALAARLTRRDGRWIISALALP